MVQIRLIIDGVGKLCIGTTYPCLCLIDIGKRVPSWFGRCNPLAGKVKVIDTNVKVA